LKFRSIKQLEIEFVPLTILIGPNNSGKTNILRAIQTPLIAEFEGISRKGLTYDLGTSKDIIYKHDLDKKIVIKYEFEKPFRHEVCLKFSSENGIDIIKDEIRIKLENSTGLHVSSSERYIKLLTKD